MKEVAKVEADVRERETEFIHNKEVIVSSPTDLSEQLLEW